MVAGGISTAVGNSVTSIIILGGTDVREGGSSYHLSPVRKSWEIPSLYVVVLMVV